MRLPSIHRIPVVSLAVLCALFSSTFSISTEAADDQWAEQFKTPFNTQIIQITDASGQAVPQVGYGATLRTVAGLNVGDAILVDGSDLQAHEAVVASINPSTHWVTWTPALPGSTIAALNLFVRATESLFFPKQSVIDQNGRIYTADTFNDRVVVFNANGTILWTIGSYGRVYSDAFLGPEAVGDCSLPGDLCDNLPQQHLGRFFRPRGIDVSADGKTIVVADTDNHRIQV